MIDRQMDRQKDVNSYCTYLTVKNSTYISNDIHYYLFV